MPACRVPPRILHAVSMSARRFDPPPQDPVAGRAAAVLGAQESPADASAADAARAEFGTGEPCKACGSKAGHAWLCQDFVEQTAQHMANAKYRRVLGKYLSHLKTPPFEQCLQTAATYDALGMTDAADHWRRVAVQVRALTEGEGKKGGVR